MYRVGQEEIDAVAQVINSKQMFRYHAGGQCERFEQRYAKYLGVKHACMTASGTSALVSALTGLGIGPGDEVIVPAHTYMATAIAVLVTGAIPIIVDVDESITLDPQALEDEIGPTTGAVSPGRMWGQMCDMDAIMRIARKHKLLVVEDACQAVGGGYEGKKAGSIGHAGAFSFNYFKNMTCGEGGCVVANDEKVMRRARCATDCCGFYWQGRNDDVRGFASNSSRASEFEGAIMNAQLDRIDGMMRETRKQKKRLLREGAKAGLTPAPSHSIDHECGTHAMFRLPSPQQAERFVELAGGTITGKTGRHPHTARPPVLQPHDHAHPALNPHNLPQTRNLRRKYTKDMCERSLQTLACTVMIGTHPDRIAEEQDALIQRIKK